MPEFDLHEEVKRLRAETQDWNRSIDEGEEAKENYNADVSILEKMEDVTTFKSGFFIALPIGFLLSASMNFLMYSSKTLNLEFFITDVFIGSVSTAIMSGAIGTTLGKVK